MKFCQHLVKNHFNISSVQCKIETKELFITVIFDKHQSILFISKIDHFYWGEMIPSVQSDPWYPGLHPSKQDPLMWWHESPSKQFPHTLEQSSP